MLLFCQVGRFVELYGPQRLAALRRLRLAVIYRPRAGFGYAVGWPLALAAVFEQRALAAGVAVVHVGESGEADTGACAPRRVTRMVLPHVKEWFSVLRWRRGFALQREACLPSAPQVIIRH